MSETYTRSITGTFTSTDAKYLASKVKTDLTRLHNYYYQVHRHPTIEDIEDFYCELILLLEYNFLDTIAYGFRVDGRFVKALKYQAGQGGIANEDPGRIEYTEIPNGASFYSVVSYNSRWNSLSARGDKQMFLKRTPVKRIPGGDFSGNWSHKKTYSSSGRELLRFDI